MYKNVSSSVTNNQVIVINGATSPSGKIDSCTAAIQVSVSYNPNNPNVGVQTGTINFEPKPVTVPLVTNWNNTVEGFPYGLVVNVSTTYSTGDTNNSLMFLVSNVPTKAPVTVSDNFAKGLTVSYSYSVTPATSTDFQANTVTITVTGKSSI
jgi:hypothetical protein